MKTNPISEAKNIKEKLLKVKEHEPDFLLSKKRNKYTKHVRRKT